MNDGMKDKIFDDALDEKIVLQKLKKNLIKIGLYSPNKFDMERLQHDLRNHPEYIKLVAYIIKILDKKNRQIKRLKRQVVLLKEKAKLSNVEQSTQTENNTSESIKPDEFDSDSLRPTSDTTQSKNDLSIGVHPSLSREESILINVEKSTQTENVMTELNKNDGINAASSWHSEDTTKSDEQLSIAEQVKQVAENVIADAGMVYVESAGMYYDSKSGYYYSPELGLYYHNTTGCYYYFDKEKNEFSYYSHPANTNPHLQNDNNQQHFLVHHENEKKPGPRRRNKKEKRGDNEDMVNRKSAKRKASSDPSQKKKLLNNHLKDPNETFSRKSQEKKKKVESRSKEIEVISEKSNDSKDNKISKKVKKEGITSERNQNILPLSNPLSTGESSEKSTDVNPEKGVDSEVEDGECSSTSGSSSADESECDASSSSESSSSSDASCFDESVAKHHPPCIRIIVKDTSLERLKVGSLFIITKDGGSLGREGTYHSVILPDENVSRHHLNFHYDIKNKCYHVVDVGSQNGTILNGKRMSVAKQESQHMKLAHGSTLTFGNTTLLCHVHDGNDTCGHCEPGLIQADNEEKVHKAYKPSTNLRKQYRQELQRLRSKYANKVIVPKEDGDKYKDRAAVRRDTVGSTHSAEKTEQGDLQTSITDSNKGFKMLEKMGWSKGEGLGKKKQGDTNPVPLVSNEGSSGLGAGGVGAVLVPPARPGPVWRARLSRPPVAVAKLFRQPDNNDEDND